MGAVVGQKRMEQVHFKFSAEDHGGIVGEGFDNGPRHKRSSLPEYTVTLSEIFEKFQVPNIIDYLSLDVEGAESFILNGFPFNEYQIKVMTIERPKEDLRRVLEQNGYQQILRLSRWGETLWIHSDFAGEMDTTHLSEYEAKKQQEREKALHRGS